MTEPDPAAAAAYKNHMKGRPDHLPSPQIVLRAEPDYLKHRTDHAAATSEGARLLAEAKAIYDSRLGERRELWKTDGALFHTIMMNHKVKRVLWALSDPSMSLEKVRAVFDAEAPDILNYLFFAAQQLQRGDVSGGLPLCCLEERGELN